MNTSIYAHINNFTYVFIMGNDASKAASAKRNNKYNLDSFINCKNKVPPILFFTIFVR